MYQVKKLENSVYKDSFSLVQQQYNAIASQKERAVVDYSRATDISDVSLQEQKLQELKCCSLVLIACEKK
jgi:hypothetical protein